jgi:arsenite methyltransferase
MATTEEDAIVSEVRERYGRIALGGESCCGPSGCCGPAEVPVSLGRHLALRDGKTVLDLGSGAGIDAFLAAREVGPRGHVIGVEMTPDMIERAGANAIRMGVAHVEFREGRLESLPVEDASVDAVTSNCVINLVPDKARVFAEIARALKPGGRLVISDVVLDGRLPEAVERDVYAYVGCASGATLREDYLGPLSAAGVGAGRGSGARRSDRRALAGSRGQGAFDHLPGAQGELCGHIAVARRAIRCWPA